MLTRLGFALALAVGMSQAIAEGEEPSTGDETSGACGDGVVDPGEICDDGNPYSDDGCSATCSIDNYPPIEPGCGDGRLDDGEECDDGNLYDGDGCARSCDFEA